MCRALGIALNESFYLYAIDPRYTTYDGIWLIKLSVIDGYEKINDDHIMLDNAGDGNVACYQNMKNSK